MVDYLQSQLLVQQHTFQVHLAQLREQIVAKRRGLIPFGFKLYSKSEEDGIIQEIFNRIGPGKQRFAEIGIEWGIECNTVKLLVEGWSGVWVEVNPQHVDKACRHFQPFIDLDAIEIKSRKVTVENINDLITEDFDILGIDIDGNDYWVWEALKAKPRVVVIEYNSYYAPPLSIVAPYRHTIGAQDGSNYGGASLEALFKLGKKKGYILVGCDISGSNAFFVSEEYELFFPYNKTSESLFEPHRPYFSLGAYEWPNPKPFVRID